MSRTIQKVTFTIPPPQWERVNFKIKFSLLRLVEMARSPQKSLFPNSYLHVNVGWVDRINLQNTMGRNRMVCSNLHRKIMFASSFPSWGLVQFTKIFFL